MNTLTLRAIVFHLIRSLLALACLGLVCRARAAGLVNVDFTASLSPVKTGAAAVGEPNDFWNRYSRDIDPNSQWNWRENGTITNLLWADRTASPIDLAVTNAPGAWGSGAQDAMMGSYLYPFAANSRMTVTLTEVPAGSYDLYFYAHGQPPGENGVIGLTSGGQDYGMKTTSTALDWDFGQWVEGFQYVLFRDLQVHGDGTITITILPGSTGLPVMNGLQLVATASVPSSSCVSAPAGLIGWWRGEGSAMNSMGGDPGSFSPSVTFPAAKVSRGFQFNGVDGRVTVPDAASLNFGPGASFSIEAWIEADAKSGKYAMSIVDKRLAPAVVDGVPFNAAVGYTLYLVDGRLGMQLADTPLGNFRFRDYYSPGPDLRDGKFHHVAATVDRNSPTGGRLYVDGQVVLTFDPTLAAGDLTNPEPLRIGYHASEGFDGFFAGIIDEVSIYSRALSATEIVSVSNAGAGGKCATSDGRTYDLRTDWSDRSNPNGPWSYRAEEAILPWTPNWQLDEFAQPQGGWGFGSVSLPFWFKSSSAPLVPKDWQVGDVVVHTHTSTPFIGKSWGTANVTWTSPTNGTISIRGGVWPVRDIADLDGGMRSNRWNLSVRGVVLASGVVGGGDPYDRAHPMLFNQGAASPGQLDGIPVSVGDVVKLELVSITSEGDYVGVNLAIDSKPSSSPPALDGLLAQWSFEEADGLVVRDSLGTYDGHLSGAGVKRVAGGISGQALSIDAAGNGLVNFGDVLGFSDAPFSIVAWVRMAAGDRQGNRLVLAKHESGYNNGYFLNVNHSNSILGQDDKAMFYAGNGNIAPVSTTTVNDGNWRQLVAVHNVAGDNLIYVDGAPVEGMAPSLAVGPSPAPLLIGGASFDGVPTGMFTGLIDEVQVYGRALTPGEVDTLYKRAAVKEEPVQVSTLAGSGEVGFKDGIAGDAIFNAPNGGSVGTSRAAYIADTRNNRIRRVDTVTGAVTTIAGNGTAGFADGPGSTAMLNQPLGVFAHSGGAIFVADTGNNRVRKISADTPPSVSTYAGSGIEGYKDGPAAEAQFNFPNDLVFDSKGNIYISEFNNHTIRKLDLQSYMVSTFVGNGVPGFADGQGTTAGLNQPAGLAIDHADNLYVTEWGSHRIRKVTPGGVVTTLAGSVFPGWFDDQGVEARFFRPDGIVVDPQGVLFVADNGNHVIRRITPGGLVTTLAGTTKPGWTDGSAASAQFNAPGGLGLDVDGTLVVADTGNNRIRLVSRVVAPSIVSAPANTTVVRGTNVQLSVTAGGSAPFSYQWRFKNADIPGATEALLFLPNVQVDQTGAYTVVVRNAAGMTVSPAAILTVLQPLAFERTLPAYYSPGAALPVRLSPLVGVTAPVQAYAVEDTPPPNWGVSAISNGGVYDLATRKVKFGPFFDSSPRFLTYTVTPPVDESGNKVFSGITSADGIETATLGASNVSAAPLHPADLNPADHRLSINEVTTYASAWRKGQPWSVGPNPIPVDYVTRAGLLWKNGEVYTFNAAVPRAPGWWVNPSVLRVASVTGSHLAVFAPTNLAERVLPVAFTPGKAFTVLVQINPAEGVMAYAVEERVPSQLAVSEISQAGEFHPASRLIRWGPFFDHEARALSYVGNAPAGLRDILVFDGIASFDGASQPIRGTRSLVPATTLGTVKLFGAGELQISLEGDEGKSYRIEASRDLKLWEPLSLSTNQGGILRFVDPEADRAPARFYRAAPQAP